MTTLLHACSGNFYDSSFQGKLLLHACNNVFVGLSPNARYGMCNVQCAF
jgi:hypothetical protein